MARLADSERATYAAAIDALVEHGGLSEHDLGDARDLFKEDPRVPQVYMAIEGEAVRGCYLRKQLAIYRTKMCNDGKSG